MNFSIFVRLLRVPTSFPLGPKTKTPHSLKLAAFCVSDAGYLITPVRRGNQYQRKSAAGLPRTDEDLSINGTGG